MARKGGTPENLIPAKKGEVRNPAGRPVGAKNRSTVLNKWIEVNTNVKNPITKLTEPGTVEDLIALALINKALSGDVAAIREIQDTIHGKIPDKAELTGKDGNPLIPIRQFDLSKLSEDELRSLDALQSKIGIGPA